jgi:hypothetical protein
MITRGGKEGRRVCWMEKICTAAVVARLSRCALCTSSRASSTRRTTSALNQGSVGRRTVHVMNIHNSMRPAQPTLAWPARGKQPEGVSEHTVCSRHTRRDELICRTAIQLRQQDGLLQHCSHSCLLQPTHGREESLKVIDIFLNEVRHCLVRHAAVHGLRVHGRTDSGNLCCPHSLVVPNKQREGHGTFRAHFRSRGVRASFSNCPMRRPMHARTHARTQAGNSE